MTLANELAMYARFAWHLIGYLHEPRWTANTATAAIRDDLQNREQRFLGVLAKQVYGNPHSPYFRLLEWAGWKQEDVANNVRINGLEGTLDSLAKAGVYVTLEEYKGSVPIRRGSLQFTVQNSDFDNCRGRPDFLAHTSGTSGAATRVPMYLTDVGEQSRALPVLLHGLHLEGHRKAFWFPLGGAAILALLYACKINKPPERWFSNTNPALAGLSWRYRYSGWLVSAWIRLVGVSVPSAEPVEVENVDPVLDWCLAGDPVYLSCLTSNAVRLCRRAVELNRSLSQATILLAGEPLTPAGHRAIIDSGASVVGLYASADTGHLGYSCPHSPYPDDYHFRMDRFAVITNEQGGDGEGAALLLLTSLAPSSGKILLNTSIGDMGEITQDDCTCCFASVGLKQHIRRVQTQTKIVAEGMTVLKTTVAQVLETVLPAKLGGTPRDYQLVQRRNPKGMETLELWLSPDVRVEDDNTVIRTFLEALVHLEAGMRLVADVWIQAGTLRVVRSTPILSDGKYPNLRIQNAETS